MQIFNLIFTWSAMADRWVRVPHSENGGPLMPDRKRTADDAQSPAEARPTAFGRRSAYTDRKRTAKSPKDLDRTSVRSGLDFMDRTGGPIPFFPSERMPSNRRAFEPDNICL
jgi:hypothetical protein